MNRSTPSTSSNTHVSPGERNVNVGALERRLSTIGGGALVLYGLSRRSLGGLLLALAGGNLVYRGTTGHCTVYNALGVSTAAQAPGLQAGAPSIHVEKTVTVNRPVAEVYCCWREFENLPRFMKHLESVEITGPGRSHWVAKAPLSTRVEWDAEVINDQENRLIAWRSLGDTAVSNAGMVRFEEAPGGRGTQVHVMLEYNPPAGVIGATFAKLFGEEPSRQVDEDLQRFKQMLEAGEIATTQGQTSGPARKIGDAFHADRQRELDVVGPRSTVQQASEESFPASDPPSFTPRPEKPSSR